MEEEEKITLNKAELILMLTQYWALDNNDICEKATRLFVERNNLKDLLHGWIDINDFEKPDKEDIEAYIEELQYIIDERR